MDDEKEGSMELILDLGIDPPDQLRATEGGEQRGKLRVMLMPEGRRLEIPQKKSRAPGGSLLRSKL